ncbi:MAG: double-strand break repair protein AddB, partial [Bradyrhizobium sp.]
PGLDTDLDDEAWQSIGGIKDAQGKFIVHPASNHPQFAMHALLKRFNLARGDVEVIAPPASDGRDMLASEAMRPSHATGRWHERLQEADISAKIAAGMANLAVIEAPNAEMEALAIAVAMREARHLSKSASLVTPDRALARRVMAALARWKLDFDDSGGDALMETPAGIFARLAAETVAKGLEPATLLALLKHPLCRLGRAADELKAAVEALELALLRGTRPQAGTSGLAHDFGRFRDNLASLRRGEVSSLHVAERRAHLTHRQIDGIQALIAALQAALAPLESLASLKPYDFAELAQRHREALIALSRDEDDVARAFDGDDGLALAAAFDDLLDEERRSGLMLQLSDYPEVFQTAFADRAVRRPGRSGAQLHIYGPLESRLMQADRVIVGALIEGVWPPAPRMDPWLSRPMRHELGLDLP